MNIKINKIPVGPLQANCYIISSEELSKVLIIDSGGDFLKIKEEISNLKKEAGCVILTHCHFDHMGACKDFENMGVPIYTSKTDSMLITSHSNLGDYFGIPIRPFTVDKFLSEGKQNICGFDVEIINTPGHTAGGISIKIEGNIFTGDTLFKDSYGRTEFPTGSMDDLSESAKKLFEIKEDCTIYPGHGEESSLFYERENNPINMYIKR